MKVNLKEAFKDLEFEPIQHLYSVGGQILPSVSGLVSSFYYPFDSKYHSERLAFAEGCEPEELLARWKLIADAGCLRGSDIHNYAERWTADKYGLITDAMLSDTYYHEYVAVHKLWRDMPPHISIVALEMRMYSKDYGYAGTADVILYDSISKTYIILDYKTNKQLFDTYGNKMIAPFTHLEETAFNKYQLQLSFYQILLEAVGAVVSRRMIVHLVGEEYYIYDTEDYTKELIKNLVA